MFSKKTNRVITLSRRLAQRFNHDYLGTEHLLGGIILEGHSVTADALIQSGASAIKFGIEFEKLSPPKTEFFDAKKATKALDFLTAIALAGAEAYNEDTSICPVHLLVGITNIKRCKGFRILENLGLDIDELCITAVMRYQEKLRAKDGK